MYLDGVRDQGTYFRDTFNIQNVEVLKGPASIYFGRGSTGGIINQVSKAPQLEGFYDGTASAGSARTFAAPRTSISRSARRWLFV